MSSLKSPSIIQGDLHSDTYVNSLDSIVIRVVWDTLGDLYTTATCILPTLGNCIVVDTASMPLVANLCVLHGFIWLGTQIKTPPLFSQVILSHLMSIWSLRKALKRKKEEDQGYA